MARTPERNVKSKVTAMLADAGVWYYTPIASVYARAGVPDILCGYRSEFFAVECKANGGTLSRIQEFEIAKMRSAGNVVLVIDETNLHELAAYLANLKARYRHIEHAEI